MMDVDFSTAMNKNSRIRAEIEEVILNFVQQLFDKKIRKWQCITIKGRNGGNMLCSFVNPKPFVSHLQVLSQVHRMLLIGQKATKRDLFYENKALYKDQTFFNRSLKAVCKLLGTTRRDLRVVGSSRGFAVGSLLLADNGVDGSTVDFRHHPVAILERLTDYRRVEGGAAMVLIVEKDAIFQRLIDERFTAQFPDALLVTGRGYPDICTREFLNWLAGRISAKFLVLVDADPYGIEIFLTYKYGSRKAAAETRHAAVPSVRFIGLRSTDAGRLPIDDSHFLPLAAMDHKRLWSVGKRLEAYREQDLLDELHNLQTTCRKLELEAVSSITTNFLSSVYLRQKFEEILCPSGKSPMLSIINYTKL